MRRRHRALNATTAWAVAAGVSATVLVLGVAARSPTVTEFADVDGRTWLSHAVSSGPTLLLANGISGIVEAAADSGEGLPDGLAFVDSSVAYTLLSGTDTTAVVDNGTHRVSVAALAAGESAALAADRLWRIGASQAFARPAGVDDASAEQVIDLPGAPVPGAAVVDETERIWVLRSEPGGVTALRIDGTTGDLGSETVPAGTTGLILIDGQPAAVGGSEVVVLGDGRSLPAPRAGGLVPSVAERSEGWWATAAGDQVTVVADDAPASSIRLPSEVTDLAVWAGRVWASTATGLVGIEDGEGAAVPDTPPGGRFRYDGGRLWVVADGFSAAIDQRGHVVPFQVAAAVVDTCVYCDLETAKEYLEERADEFGSTTSVQPDPGDEDTPAPTSPATTTPPTLSVPLVAMDSASTTEPPLEVTTTTLAEAAPSTTSAGPPPASTAAPTATAPPTATTVDPGAGTGGGGEPGPAVPTFPVVTTAAEQVTVPPETAPAETQAPRPPPPQPTNPPQQPPPTLPPGSSNLQFGATGGVDQATVTYRVLTGPRSCPGAQNRMAQGSVAWSGPTSGSMNVPIEWAWNASRSREGSVTVPSLTGGSYVFTLTACGQTASIAASVSSTRGVVPGIVVSPSPAAPGTSVTAAIGDPIAPAGWSVVGRQWSAGPCGGGTVATASDTNQITFTVAEPSPWCISVVVTFAPADGSTSDAITQNANLDVGTTVAPETTVPSEPTVPSETTIPSETTVPSETTLPGDTTTTTSTTVPDGTTTSTTSTTIPASTSTSTTTTTTTVPVVTTTTTSTTIPPA